MKTLLLTLSLLACGIRFTNGQEQAKPASILTTEITELCDLTQDQLIKVQPIVADFEKKRDAAYRKFAHNITVLSKEVKQNRWNYEVALIGILTPEQMGLLKAFDQRNKGLMTGSSCKVTKVDYLLPDKRPNIQPQPVVTASADKPQEPTSPNSNVTIVNSTATIVQTAVIEAPKEQTVAEAIPAAIQTTTQVVTESNTAHAISEQPTYQSILIDQMKELCDLSPEQVLKVQPLVANFEKRRDETYSKYKNNSTILTKEVKQNRWDYEVSLIGTLTPEQMGLLKAFDQRNPELMAGSGTTVTSVDYLIARQ